ncbi:MULTISPECIES: diacylglycerol/lipid kinase family protein [Nocardiopsis]|uniref:Diacylglycerol kinase catalytic region n=1 Tax=Nocardiopsis dassonvillei (strain ATCC 23218 / DSM 43111 / CIP 107115 / JCM 7437 / KCTC 9190 / NBRC 14626 / NCTC 10488 / NRRL B-5397 / IMRU 509) TaxID=446468 RepID=D7B3Y5_NOCDD|nr:MULTISPECIES: YegS/Rv2252/BmrU family lipid kinase [Nocardiopsis]ADH66946.1 diacylglycerol kinase catalytic region [Nocardiopsis dassonvillei subsp. dassonvillei DSM 43111]APC35209.1 lipid kinase [Nocardiopsis dassonvillei]NKY80351.1 YegS/Rv2252/BmrU family lipid kinase [Nocardiopsis dassonvillei]VEI86734.1 Diacylglycerol kinase [Nocardiopsis dassonvillei]
MPPHIALLVNPNSGRRRAAVVAVRLKEALREAGARVHVYTGRSAADSRRMARLAASDRPDALVAVGGDGLVHQALQAVVGTGVPLAVVPTGTGNDIARAFGRPRGSARDVAEAVLRGRTRPADAVRLTLADGTQRYFLSVLACGFDARVNERVNGFRHRIGRAGYVAGILAELRSFHPIDYDIEVDGRRIAEPGMLVAVGNTSAYGGGMHVCPDAVPDDGLLDVVFVRQAPIGRFLSVFPRVFNGSHTGLDEVVVERGRTVTIRGAAGVAYADGERVGEPPLVCEVTPKAVEMLELTS